MITTGTLQGHRNYQQDAFGHKEYDGNLLIVVCDGMGGVGNESEKLSKAVVEHILALEPKNRHDLKEAIRLGGNKWSKVFNGGTTCVAALISGDQAAIATVGDSRIYEWDKSQLTQLTKDETVLQELIDNGRYNQEDADEGRVTTYGHMLTNCISKDTPVFKITSTDIMLQKGCSLILASDGLWDRAGHSWLQEVFSVSIDAQTVCQTSFDHGSQDNITAVVYTHE